MNQKPRPRWFAFSLRTMFALITALCIWLGWNAEIVRERKVILAEIVKTCPHRSSLFIETLEADPDSPFYFWIEDREWARVSSVRRLLGAESCVLLAVGGPIDPQLAERMENAFPEAKLAIIQPGPDAKRDPLYGPIATRHKNRGTIFKTGLK